MDDHEGVKTTVWLVIERGGPGYVDDVISAHATSAGAQEAAAECRVDGSMVVSVDIQPIEVTEDQAGLPGFTDPDRH